MRSPSIVGLNWFASTDVLRSSALVRDQEQIGPWRESRLNFNRGLERSDRRIAVLTHFVALAHRSLPRQRQESQRIVEQVRDRWDRIGDAHASEVAT